MNRKNTAATNAPKMNDLDCGMSDEGHSVFFF